MKAPAAKLTPVALSTASILGMLAFFVLGWPALTLAPVGALGTIALTLSLVAGPALGWALYRKDWHRAGVAVAFLPLLVLVGVAWWNFL